MLKQEPSTTGKTRRRGGRNNRKRGARRDSDPQPQPQQPQGQPMQPQQATQAPQGPPKGAKGSAKAKSQPKGRSTEAGQPVLAAGPVAVSDRKSEFRPQYTQTPMAQLLLQQQMQCRGSPPVIFSTLRRQWRQCPSFLGSARSVQGTAPVSGSVCCSGSKFHLFHANDVASSKQHAKSDSVWRKRDEDLALERPHPLTMLARTKPKSEPVLFKAQAKEIRALFEWVDPAQGETRALLREKHGEGQEDELAAAAAEESWAKT
eukprot:s1451_g11.t1